VSQKVESGPNGPPHCGYGGELESLAVVEQGAWVVGAVSEDLAIRVELVPGVVILHPDLVKRNRKAPDQIGLELDHAQRHGRATLQSLPAGSRLPTCALYAAAPAEWLFRWYDARPETERRSYSLTWRPVLHDVWDHLAGDESAHARISRASASSTSAHSATTETTAQRHRPTRGNGDVLHRMLHHARHRRLRPLVRAARPTISTTSGTAKTRNVGRPRSPEKSDA
jgi:hypothetical protein